MPRGAANQRRFKAGKESRFREERMAEDRRAWLKTFIGQFILRIAPAEDESKENGDSVWLVIPRPNSRPISLNITALTAEELELTRQFFNAVFDIAEPICKDRDKAAQDAFDRGDDSHIRLYRTVPELIVRQGAIGSNGEVLRDRLKDVATGPERHADSFGHVREDVDAVADGDEGQGEPEDDLSAADQPEVVREVGGLGERAGGLLPSHPSEGHRPPAP